MKTLIVIFTLINLVSCAHVKKSSNSIKCVQLAAEIIVAFCSKPVKKEYVYDTTKEYAIKKSQEIDPQKRLVFIDGI